MVSLGVGAFFAAAVDAEAVEQDGESGSYKRPDYHDPEGIPCACTFGEECGAEAASGVDRAVVDCDASNVDQSEADTDCKSGKFSCAFVFVGRGKDDEDEEHGQQHFGKEGELGRCSGLENVGG